MRRQLITWASSSAIPCTNALGRVRNIYTGAEAGAGPEAAAPAAGAAGEVGQERAKHKKKQESEPFFSFGKKEN